MFHSHLVYSIEHNPVPFRVQEDKNKMARPKGFKPLTHVLEGHCAIHCAKGAYLSILIHSPP